MPRFDSYGDEGPVYIATPDGLPYGNGCSLHPDCFTCPEHDCIASYFSIHRVRRNRGAHREEQLSATGAGDPSCQ